MYIYIGKTRSRANAFKRFKIVVHAGRHKRMNVLSGDGDGDGAQRQVKVKHFTASITPHTRYNTLDIIVC